MMDVESLLRGLPVPVTYAWLGRADVLSTWLLENASPDVARGVMQVCQFGNVAIVPCGFRVRQCQQSDWRSVAVELAQRDGRVVAANHETFRS